MTMWLCVTNIILSFYCARNTEQHGEDAMVQIVFFFFFSFYQLLMKAEMLLLKNGFVFENCLFITRKPTESKTPWWTLLKLNYYI